MPFKANAARGHHIPKQKRRVTHWAAYNARAFKILGCGEMSARF